MSKLKSKEKFLFTFLFLFSLIISVLNPTLFSTEEGLNLYKIAPELLESIQRDEIREVVIILRDPDYDYLKTMKFQRGIEEVKRFLKSHAYMTQSNIKELISSLGGSVLNDFWITNALLVKLNTKSLPIIASNPLVERIVPNFEVKIVEFVKETETITTSSEVSSWGIMRIGAPEVWNMGFNGSGIRICVIDTGVDISHLALSGKLFTVDPANPYYPGGWIAFDSTGRPYLIFPQDTHGHGTHVSGTALGGDTENVLIGVAPGAILMHALALPYGSGTFAQTIAALEWAADPYYIDPATGEIRHTYITPHVVSMSWGARNYYGAEFLNPIKHLLLLNIIPVAAIGNAGPGTHSNPGNIWGVFGIGATDEYDAVASFSGGARIYWPYIPPDWPFNGTYPSTYIKPDFTAPGVRIISSIPGGGYAAWSGTSMATPHVSGLVALIIQATKWDKYQVPDMPLKIYEILMSTSIDLGSVGQDTRYGWGIVDAPQAVKKALELSKISGVRGTVYDSHDNKPIPLVDIYAYNTRGELVAYTQTNATGYYVLPLDPGRYTLLFSRFGYHDKRIEVDVHVFNGTIVGSVVDKVTNEPIKNALIQVVEANITTMTNENGFYQLTVPPGRYTLRASAEGYFNASKVIVVEERGLVVVDFQLYSLSSAATVYVDVREFFTKKPIENAKVSILELGLETLTNATGVAVFNMIPPGAYTFVTSKEYYATRLYSIGLNPGEQIITVDTTYIIGVMTRDKAVFGEDIRQALISQGYPSYAIELLDPLQITKSYKAIVLNYFGPDPGSEQFVNFLRLMDAKNTSLVFLDAWGAYYNFAGYLMHKYSSEISTYGYPAPQYRSDGYMIGLMVEALDPSHSVFSGITFDEVYKFYIGIAPVDRVDYAVYQGFIMPRSGELTFLGQIVYGGSVYGYSVVSWNRSLEPDRWLFLSVGGSYHWSRYMERGQDTQYSLNMRKLLFNALLWSLGINNVVDESAINNLDIYLDKTIEISAFTEVTVTMDRKPHGWVLGKITAADTGLPLRDVVVSVLSTPVKAVTNQTGFFNIWLPGGVYKLKLDAKGYYSVEKEVSITVGVTTYVEEALVRKPRAAVMIDYNGQITLFLQEKGWYAQTYRDWSELYRELDFYDVLVLAGEYIGSSYLWPDKLTFESILNKTYSRGIGIVFLNNYFEYRYIKYYPYGINLLYYYYRNPGSVGTGYGDGPVYYVVIGEHPILADYGIGDTVYLVHDGDYDYAWFSKWDGEVLAYIGAETVGVRGLGIGVKTTPYNTRWVLLAGLAPEVWTNMDHWSDDAKEILHKAISWAAVKPINISVVPYSVYVGDTIVIEIPPLPGIIYSIYLDNMIVYRDIIGKNESTTIKLRIPNLERGLHTVKVISEGLFYGEAKFFVNTKLEVLTEDIVGGKVLVLRITGHPSNANLLIYIDDNYLTSTWTSSVEPLTLYVTIPEYFKGAHTINIRTIHGETIVSKDIVIKESVFESGVISQLFNIIELYSNLSSILKQLGVDLGSLNATTLHGLEYILNELTNLGGLLLDINSTLSTIYGELIKLPQTLEDRYEKVLDRVLEEKLKSNREATLNDTIEALRELESNLSENIATSEKTILGTVNAQLTLIYVLVITNILISLLTLLLRYKKH